MSRYAISDIHGCLSTFKFLVEREIKLQPTDTLYLLGDYIDRGPDSKGVIDYILKLQDSGYQVHCLMGNHEDMLLQARADSEFLNQWLLNGGKAALISFGTNYLGGISEKYWKFFESLEFYFELEDYYLVHAGFDFAEPDPFIDTSAMLWIRDFAIDHEVLGKRLIVHGHTPTPLSDIKKLVQAKSAALNIDGGCVFASRFSSGIMGYLTALNLDTLELHAVKCLDAV